MITIAEMLKAAVWDKAVPAKSDSIQKLVEGAGKELPEDYLALLRHSDGGEGALGMDLDGFNFGHRQMFLSITNAMR